MVVEVDDMARPDDHEIRIPHRWFSSIPGSADEARRLHRFRRTWALQPLLFSLFPDVYVLSKVCNGCNGDLEKPHQKLRIPFFGGDLLSQSSPGNCLRRSYKGRVCGVYSFVH